MVEDLIKEYVDVKSKISNLQTRERILYDIIYKSISGVVNIPYYNSFIECQIEDSIQYIVPMRYLPHIDPEKNVATFFDGREVELEEVVTSRLIISIKK